eukprot:2586464-Lingulodinium_polyedra.AAC.1
MHEHAVDRRQARGIAARTYSRDPWSPSRDDAPETTSGNYQAAPEWCRTCTMRRRPQVARHARQARQWRAGDAQL